jgi:uncharacterized GH25 family protein
MKRILQLMTLSILGIVTCGQCSAHDLWIETNTSFVRNKEVVSVAFKLGNCDEGRRDFKTKGLIDKDGTVVESISASQQRVDLVSSLNRSSSDPSGGFWTSVCLIEELGTNWFTQSLDQVIEHDGKKMRGIVTAKAFVIASKTLEPPTNSKANQLLNLPVEFELQSSAFPSIEEKARIRVRLLLESKPLRDVTVSFLPQGINLDDVDDADFEVVTDRNGIAEFQPKKANLYLISARHITANSDPTGPTNIYYSTSLTLRVTNRGIADFSEELSDKAKGK